MEEKDTTSFITKWETTAPEEAIYIAANSDYDYDFTIDWGDGTVECINQVPDINMFEHIYSDPGVYRVAIQGKFPAFNMNTVFEFSDDEGKKLVGMEQWGNIVWQDLSCAFRWCTEMLYTATDAPDLSKVTSLEKTFQGAWHISGDLSGWDTSTITNMAYMFSHAFTDNGEIGGWDTSNVTDMTGMFFRVGSFNMDISGWDTSGVTSMGFMFKDATSFNGDLSGWDTSKVKDMIGMFDGATSFNGDISSWDTKNVTHMTDMFKGATSFNGDLSGWDTSKAISMKNMFSGATSFDQDLGGWDIGSVLNMLNMLNNSGMSALNFSNTLIGWAGQEVQPNVTLGAEGLHVCFNDASGLAAFTTLTSEPNNWEFVWDGLKNCN